MNKKLTIYHNPSCSKSQCALDYLNEVSVDYSVVEYLIETPNFKELKELLDKLKMTAFDLIRKGEEEFILNFESKELSNDEWIQVMVENPKLIERPIVLFGDKAVVARPMEKIAELLNEK